MADLTVQDYFQSMYVIQSQDVLALISDVSLRNVQERYPHGKYPDRQDRLMRQAQSLWWAIDRNTKAMIGTMFYDWSGIPAPEVKEPVVRRKMPAMRLKQPVKTKLAARSESDDDSDDLEISGPDYNDNSDLESDDDSGDEKDEVTEVTEDDADTRKNVPENPYHVNTHRKLAVLDYVNLNRRWLAANCADMKTFPTDPVAALRKAIQFIVDYGKVSEALKVLGHRVLEYGDKSVKNVAVHTLFRGIAYSRRSRFNTLITNIIDTIGLYLYHTRVFLRYPMFNDHFDLILHIILKGSKSVNRVLNDESYVDNLIKNNEYHRVYAAFADV